MTSGNFDGREDRLVLCPSRSIRIGDGVDVVNLIDVVGWESVPSSARYHNRLYHV